MAEEFLTGDYVKVFDMLNMNKKEFLDFYSYLDEESYNLSFDMLRTPEYLADLFRQAENLFQLENDYSNEEILGMEYMNEVGTDYISSGDWKWAITKFISKVLSRDEFEEFKCRCESMGV